MADPRAALRIAQTARPTGRRAELHPRFMWLADVAADRPYVWAAHDHAHYEIIVVRRGRYRCRIDREAVVLGPGELLVVRPGDRHEDVLAPPLGYVAINLTLHGDGGRRSADLFRPDAPASSRRLAASADDWLAHADRLAGECARVAPDAAILDALCAELLRRILRSIPSEILDQRWSDPADDAFAARLQAAFDAHPGRAVPVAVLARACGLPVRAFTARCRAATGLPPAKALLRHRCEQALRLLHDGLPVAVTAERLGFASPFHFSRAFKRHLGEAPSRVR